MNTDRRQALVQVADKILCGRTEATTRVAIDGITASGKTTFANEIAAELSARGVPTIRLQMDGYHNPKVIRHRQGRSSAMGYYEDAYDFDALVENVLIPLRPGGQGSYRPAILDLEADLPLNVDPVRPADGSVLVVDGTFLQRPGVAEHWDIVVFINTSFAEAQRRGVERDKQMLGGHEAATKAYEERYHAACQHYITTYKPDKQAHIRVANDHLTNPVIS